MPAGVSRTGLAASWNYRAMKTAADMPPPPNGKSRYYSTCPKCSAARSRAHQKAECLGITRVKLGCNHCGHGRQTFQRQRQHAWTLISKHIYRPADDKPYLRVQKYKVGEGRQYPLSHWDGSERLRTSPGGPKIPYRLPELLAADLTTCFKGRPVRILPRPSESLRCGYAMGSLLLCDLRRECRIPRGKRPTKIVTAIKFREDESSPATKRAIARSSGMA